jgi:hypothetical protein
MEWNEFLEYFVVGKVEFGDYFDHILSWWAHKDDDNVLFVKFEDMKQTPLAAVKRIATFLGYANLPQDILRTIAEKTSFDKMQDNDTVNYSWRAYRDPKALPFMRKGAIGDWKTQFSTEDSQRLDKLCQDRLGGTGLEFCFGQ